jgi:hypothetical protein
MLIIETTDVLLHDVNIASPPRAVPGFVCSTATKIAPGARRVKYNIAK